MVPSPLRLSPNKAAGYVIESPETFENTPFLASRPSSPNLPKSPRLGSPMFSPYKEKDSEYAYFDSPNTSHTLPLHSPSLGASLAAATRRSRTRLMLLSILAIGAVIAIATWQAPDHVKSQAIDYMSTAKDNIADTWKSTMDTENWSDIWQSAKEWSGVAKNPSPLEQSSNQGNTQDKKPQWQPVASKPQTESWQEQQEPLADEDVQKSETQIEKEDVAKDDDDQVADIKENQISDEGFGEEPEKPAGQPQQPPPVVASPDVYPLYVLPDPPRRPSGDPNERFISYLPHSGYHNQRIELANSMMLALVMNRTLLVPPVWIGWPMTTQPFKALQRTWDTQMELHPEAFTSRSSLDKRQEASETPAKKLTVEECKSYAKECRSTYQDTFVAWDFLVDLGIASSRVRMVDRFNMSRAYLHDLVGVKDAAKDVYLLEDLDKYYYHFHDVDHDETELLTEMTSGKYKYTVSLPRLMEATKDTKLIEIGSMFGSGRVNVQQEEFAKRGGFFQRSLAFNHPILNTPANTINELMGGSDGYIGIHARVGDGFFQRQAINNMRLTLVEIMNKLEIPESHRARLLKAGEDRVKALQSQAAAQTNKLKRHSHTKRHSKVERATSTSEQHEASEMLSMWTMAESMLEEEEPVATLAKRQSSSNDNYSTKLGPVRFRTQMKLSEDLICRGELFTDEALLPLNNPVYIATDSRSPLTEPALGYIFANFPCAFILSDFDRPNPLNKGEPVHSLKVMQSAINENDGVKLGRLFLPFMEAMVAAKGAVTIGTTGSTFSGFAAGSLHDAYWRQARGRHLRS